MPADVFPQRHQSSGDIKQPRGVEPAGLLENLLRGAQGGWESNQHGAVEYRAGRHGWPVYGNLRRGGLTTDAATGSGIKVTLQPSLVKSMGKSHTHDITRATIPPQIVSLDGHDFVT